MKNELMLIIEDQMQSFLEETSEQRDQLCYENLAEDMAKAAALVYDSCMAGQKFALEK